MAKTVERRQVYVYADWQSLPAGPQLMGTLSAVPVRGSYRLARQEQELMAGCFDAARQAR